GSLRGRTGRARNDRYPVAGKPGLCALVAAPDGGRARRGQPRLPASAAGRAQLSPDHLPVGHTSRLQARHAADGLRPVSAAALCRLAMAGRDADSAQALARVLRCWATLSGSRMKENIDRQAMTPRIMKPQKVSMGSRWSAPRQL